MSPWVTSMLAQGGGGGEVWIALILAMVVFYAIVISGNRKERKQREAMLAAIKKNDRAITRGGIIGSVVSVSDNEVTLKVDESANVKITVLRSAIEAVIADGDPKATAPR